MTAAAPVIASETRRQVLWSVAGFVFPALSAIFLTPYVVRGLGDTRYGLFLLAMTTIGFLSLLELGLASAAVHELATARAGKGSGRVDVTFWTVASLFFALGAVAGVGVELARDVIVDHVFAVEPASRDDARVAVRLAGVGLATNLFVVPFISWLRATERFDLQSKVGIITSLAGTGGAVWRGAAGDLQGALVAQIGGAVASLALMAALTLRHSAAELRPTWPSLAVARALWRFASFQMLARVAGAVGQQIGKIVLAATLGPAQLAWFGTPFSMMQRVQALLGAASAVMFPQTARLSASGDTAAVRDAFRRGQKALIPLAAALCLPFAFCAEPFLEAWISPAFARHATAPLQAAAVAFALSGAGVGYVNLLLGRGRSDAVFHLEVGHVVVHTAALWPLTRAFGATGAALAFGAGWIALALGEVAARAELGPGASRGLGRVIAATAGLSIATGVAVAPLAELSARFGVLGPLACCGLASALTLGGLALWPGLFGEDAVIVDELRAAPARLWRRVAQRLG